MDVNKVQKLNDMAMQLKKHNIVYSKEDALHQAERIYGSENDYSSETVVRPSAGGETDELKKEVRKLTFALQNMSAEFKDLQLKLAKLEEDFNNARVGQAVPRQPGSQQVLSNDAKKDMNRPIDRNNVAPSEVSIEKFFNFANK